MGQIVWGAATGHTGGMLRTNGSGEDALRAGRIHSAFAQLRTSLQKSGAEAIVVITNDHFMTFRPSLVPTFAIGTGERFESWGEGGAKAVVHRGVSGLGDFVHGALVEAGFDLARARNARLDHAFCCPLEFLCPANDVPVLPVFVNCIVEPLPTFARCAALGRALGAALRAQEEVRRIAVIGTGGVSHWLGVPESGRVNDAFDRRFVDLFVSGQLDTITSWESSWVLSEAGNGASEIRNWIVAAAAVGGSPTYLAYEPVAVWKTGIGVVEIRPT
jgi:aromatic ring-opening dioxygenase catalytic subunit (LigB family)